MSIHFCLKVALILVAFALCFVFRRENSGSTRESENRQDDK